MCGVLPSLDASMSARGKSCDVSSLKERERVKAARGRKNSVVLLRLRRVCVRVCDCGNFRSPSFLSIGSFGLLV